MNMTRGTTPTNIIDVDIDLTGATDIYVTYVQNGHTIMEKTLGDMTVDEERLTIRLTQEETFVFDPKKKVAVQIRAKFADNTAVASNIMYVGVENILKNEVI